MSEINFLTLDLNLLRVFDALAEEGGVTRAGARLGLTQSAVSHALGRLRLILQDELFVRGPDGMRPTARAREIAPRLRQGLHQLELALAPVAFVPADTRQRFTISANTYVGTLLMPQLAQALRTSAPAAELRLQALGESLGEDLQTGRSDIAIGSFGRVAPRFEREPLFTDTTVWALRAGHPAARGPALSLETLASIPHLIMATPEEQHAVDGRISEGGVERPVLWDGGGALEAALAGAGLSRSISLTVQDSLSAMAIVGQTDVAALVPRRQARVFASQYGLKLFEPPYRTTPTVIEALWRSDLSKSPPLDWLRGQLRAVAARLEASTAPGSLNR